MNLTQTVLLAMLFVDAALLVFIEEMHSPLYVGDIYVLIGDFVLLCVSFMLKNYEQHNEVKSFFADILYKLWENGILSTADIYAHGGPWRCVKFHSHHAFSKCGKHSSTLKRLTRLASKKSFLGKKKDVEMSEDEKQSWKTIFDSLCKENSYELDKDDIRSVFTIINSNRKANGQKEIAMSDEEFETIFADVDADDSGQIDFDEFVAFVQMAGKGKVSGLSADFDVTVGALEAARYKPIFDRVDEDCDGELSKEEVKRLFHLIHDEKRVALKQYGNLLMNK